MTELPQKYGADYYRTLLSKQGKRFYDGLNAQLLREDYSGRTVFSVSEPGSAASDCFAAYRALRDDHPEYFYLGFRSEFALQGNVGTLVYPILYSPETIARIRLQLRKRIYCFVRGTAALPMMEREILVYGRIAGKLDYKDNNDVRDHNIVGPVLTSSGVCEGYNALLLLCFRRIGIPCIKVYGRTKKDRLHCWTIAWINGTPVHCDVTWDRTKRGVVRYDYFNLSDRQIAHDHHNFSGPSVPVCTSEAWNYYCYNRLCVNSFQELRTRIRSNLSEGRAPLLIHFSYCPGSGDCFKEFRRALAAEQLRGTRKIYYHPELKNLAMLPA